MKRDIFRAGMRVSRDNVSHREGSEIRPLWRRRREEDLFASRWMRPPRIAISRFLPNSWRPSIAIHFRGSNYFYGVLKSNRRRKLRALLKLRKSSSFHASAHAPWTILFFIHPYKVSSNLSSSNLFRSRNIFSFIRIQFFFPSIFRIYIYIDISFSPLIVYSLRVRIYLHLSPTRSINSIRWGDNEAIDGSKRFSRHLLDRVLYNDEEKRERKKKRGRDKRYFLVREQTCFAGMEGGTREIYRGYISLCPRRSIDSY